MPALFRSSFGYFVLVVVAAAGFLTTRSGSSPTLVPIVENGQPSLAAQHFLASMNAEQKQKLVFPLTSEERTKWDFVPRNRSGLSLKEMAVEQRGLAHALLRSCSSAQGYLKAGAVMALEQVLRELESRPGRQATHRDSELYWFAIYGTPAADQVWGWRLEGHHLSLQFLLRGDRLVAATPAFLGANPAVVPSGPQAGWQTLAAEENLGRQLRLSLTEEQAQTATISDRAPREIFLGPKNGSNFESYEGLSVSRMTPPQEQLLRQLLHQYFNNSPTSHADSEWQKIQEAGWEKVHFAWAGGTDKGQGHYYRVHGPTFIVEYDNVQNGANHVHTIWHSPTNNFGSTWLREHYQNADH